MDETVGAKHEMEISSRFAREGRWLSRAHSQARVQVLQLYSWWRKSNFGLPLPVTINWSCGFDAGGQQMYNDAHKSALELRVTKTLAMLLPCCCHATMPLRCLPFLRPVGFSSFNYLERTQSRSQSWTMFSPCALQVFHLAHSCISMSPTLQQASR